MTTTKYFLLKDVLAFLAEINNPKEIIDFMGGKEYPQENSLLKKEILAQLADVYNELALIDFETITVDNLRIITCNAEQYLGSMILLKKQLRR